VTECLSEATLQTLFDGELDRERTGTIMAHLASCQNCARAAATTENENRLLIEALGLEFANAAPYERAYQQLQRAISRDEIPSVARADFSNRHRWWNIPAAIFLSPRRALVSASLALVILTTILVAAYLRKAPTSIAQIESKAPVSIAGPTPISEVANSGSKPKQGTELAGSAQPRQLIARKSACRTRRTVSQPLPGEDEFERRFAVLAATIESDAAMRPGLRVEYEHNLALLNEVIELTRTAARNNPRDSQAAQFMFAAYQGKVDFLKQVADAGHFKGQD